MKEIEKTYLAKYIPTEVLRLKPKHMLDIYLPASINHPKLRLRQTDDYYELTKKVKIDDSDASECEESTIIFSAEEFVAFSQLPGKRIVKDRYVWLKDGVSYEFNIFKEDLLGLVLIEVEFNNSQSKNALAMPDFCLADVTQDDFVAGGVLAGKKYSDLKTDLGRYGYESIEIK